MGGPATGRPFCLSRRRRQSLPIPEATMFVRYSSLALLIALAAITIVVELPT
jgi:hypothetical protein